MNVLILRDPRESKAKCSLTPLQGAPGVAFVEYRHDRRFDVGRRILLSPDGEPFGPADAGRDVLLIDCAWRRVPQLLARCDGELQARRLPRLVTAYPRTSKIHADPKTGLASVEALFAASVLLGEPHPEWLDGYRWRDEFLRANPSLLDRTSP
jgi:ribosome biogenesis protein Tsr3